MFMYKLHVKETLKVYATRHDPKIYTHTKFGIPTSGSRIAGSVPNIQGAHAVFRLGKPSFKKENLFSKTTELLKFE